MNFFKKTESYLGIDIGAGGMKLVELKKTKNRPQLWTYGVLDEPLDIHVKVETPEITLPKSGEKKAPLPPVDPRIELYATYLKELVKQTKATTKHATVSLPVSQVFHALVTLPIVPEKELDFHVKAKVSKMVSEPIDTMQVVHQRLTKKDGGPEKDIKLLVTAASKSLIQFYTAIFSRAGLILDELETEAFALERSLVGHDPATIMVVDIGAERTNFFIVDNGQPVTHRSILAGGKDIDNILAKNLGIDIAATAQVKYDLSRGSTNQLPMELFGSVTDSIVKEIEYGMDLFTHQSGNEGKRPEKIVLTGGAALFPAFLLAVQAHFSIKSFVGDPWARVVYQDRLKPILDSIGPRMSVAIGLALRNVLK